MKKILSIIIISCLFLLLTSYSYANDITFTITDYKSKESEEFLWITLNN